jgi:hypothetical protein
MDAQHTALSDQIGDVQDALDANTATLAGIPTLTRGRGLTAGLLHERNTWVFNAATTGAVAATPTHVVFTLTGRVFIDLITAFTFQTLTSGGTPAITLGTLLSPTAFMVAPTGGAPGLVTGDWWTSAASANGTVAPVTTFAGQTNTTQRWVLLSESIGLAVPVSTVTGGVLIFDVWYFPISDDGLLVPTVN